MDIGLALMSGIDIPIEECKIILHQPTIKEISYIGESVFFTGIQYLTLNKSMATQDESVLLKITNFQVFMTVMNEKQAADKKKQVKQVLNLLFPNYNIIFTPQNLLFGTKSGETFILNEENFDAFQNILKEVFCSKNNNTTIQQSFNPANAKAKEIADKLMRGRKRVAEKNGNSKLGIFGIYTSVLSVGMNIPLTATLDYTMYQIYDQMERYSLHLNWDLDVRCRLAGGSPDSKPDNWMKNIH